MKSNTFLSLALIATFIGAAFVPTAANALSCLPTDMYLKDIIGKEDVVVFVGTANEKITEKTYTAEVLEVTAALQGYVESSTFVYHQLDETWGYLCNPGPSKEKNTTSVYVAGRDNFGKYQVYQRLDVDSELANNLKKDLKNAEVTGEVSEITPLDRNNQIMTTITDMLSQIVILLKEFAYWKQSK